MPSKSSVPYVRRVKEVAALLKELPQLDFIGMPNPWAPNDIFIYVYIYMHIYIYI